MKSKRPGIDDMMPRRATRSDVALRAGCSKTTVTFVLADRQDIAIPQITRERIKAVAKELGYRPNAVAQALVSGRTQTITVAFPNLVGPYYARVLQALEQHSRASGYHLITRTIGQVDFQHVPPDLVSILDGPNDGVLLVDLPDACEPGEHVIDLRGKPVVSIGIYASRATDCVEVDLRQGVEDALQHLLSHSPQRLGFFGLPWPDEVASLVTQALAGLSDPRAVAYCRAMQQAGLPQEVIPGSAEGRFANMQLLKQYVAQQGCPDALFCYDDEVAVSAHRALREIGLQIPRDVSIVGCDGNIECEFLDPQISTIVQPLEQQCAEAWQFLMNRLADPTLPRQHTRLKAQFQRRASSQHPTEGDKIEFSNMERVPL